MKNKLAYFKTSLGTMTLDWLLLLTDILSSFKGYLHHGIVWELGKLKYMKKNIMSTKILSK